MPFYGIIFGGYTTKATLENFSKYNKGISTDRQGKWMQKGGGGGGRTLVEEKSADEELTDATTREVQAMAISKNEKAIAAALDAAN